MELGPRTGRLESVLSSSFGPPTRTGEVTSLSKVELVSSLSVTLMTLSQDKLTMVLTRSKFSAESRKMISGFCSSGSQTSLKAWRSHKFFTWCSPTSTLPGPVNSWRLSRSATMTTSTVNRTSASEVSLLSLFSLVRSLMTTSQLGVTAKSMEKTLPIRSSVTKATTTSLSLSSNLQLLLPFRDVVWLKLRFLTGSLLAQLTLGCTKTVLLTSAAQTTWESTLVLFNLDNWEFSIKKWTLTSSEEKISLSSASSSTILSTLGFGEETPLSVRAKDASL